MIQFDDEDYRLVGEMSRIGFGTIEDLRFATGDFSGSLVARLDLLSDARFVAIIRQNDEVGYCATASGIVAVYFEGAFQRSLEACRTKKLRLKKMSLRQKWSLRNGRLVKGRNSRSGKSQDVSQSPQPDSPTHGDQ